MHPTLSLLLTELAEAEDHVLANCYGIDTDATNGGDEPPLDAALMAWRRAGCPRPDRSPPLPDDYDGPCHIEVRPEWRSGRGRYWLPEAKGYTDDVTRAGVYPATYAREVTARSERSYGVVAAVSK